MAATLNSPLPDFQAAFKQGISFFQSGRLIKALECFDSILAERPNSPLVLFYRGLTFYSLGKFERAIASYDSAIALKPDFAEAYCNRGNAFQELSKFDDAIGDYDRAIALKPALPDAHNNRGKVLAQLKRQDDALASCERAIVLKPDYAQAHMNLGNILLDLKRLDEALASFDRAIASKPDYVKAHVNRGIALNKLNRPNDALACFARAIQLDPNYYKAYFSRGFALIELRRFDEAFASFKRTIELNPGYALAYWAISNLMLLRGDYEEGWKLQEWRLRTGTYQSALQNFEKPRWGGITEAAETLLVYSDAGLGDAIQFCRYMPMLNQAGVKVIMQVPSPLVDLMLTLDADIDVVAEKEPLPEFSHYCPIGSMPLAFGTTLSTIPAKFPYLSADSEKQAQWRERLGERKRPRIGLAWSGQINRNIDSSPARNRSIPLKFLEPLLRLPFDFHSLQKDVRPDDESILAAYPNVLDHRRELGDFSDTAALVANLDLIISVDTSVSHLAGALGQKVWVLLPYSADYRWAMDGPATPWYPAAELCRQLSPGDWSGVVSQAESRLKALYL